MPDPIPLQGPRKIVPGKPRRRLTAKQAKFVERVCLGDSPTQAVEDAGYDTKNRANSAVLASQLLNKTSVKNVIRQIIEDGRYDKKLLNQWDKVLDKDDDDIDSSAWANINRVKLQAVEQIARIGGLVAPKQVETRNMNVDLTSLLPNAMSTKR